MHGTVRPPRRRRAADRARRTSTPTRSCPARYLQKPRSDDFGAYLFRDLRFDRTARASGVPAQPARPTAPRASSSPSATSAADPRASTPCGRSSTTAFRAVIAPSFGDIFASNALKNGLLPIVLPARRRRRDCCAQLDAAPGAHRRGRPRRADRHAAPTARRTAFDIDPVREALPARRPRRDRLHAHAARRIEAFEARRAREWT